MRMKYLLTICMPDFRMQKAFVMIPKLKDQEKDYLMMSLPFNSNYKWMQPYIRMSNKWDG